MQIRIEIVRNIDKFPFKHILSIVLRSVPTKINFPNFSQIQRTNVTDGKWKIEKECLHKREESGDKVGWSEIFRFEKV